MRKLFSTPNDWILTLIRVVFGIVFFAHGAQKALGWFGGLGYSAHVQIFTHVMHIPWIFANLAIAAEFLGGLGLILGALTRVAAFGISVEMIVAVLMVHINNGFFMNWAGQKKGEGFEYHLLALAIAVLLMVRGGGAFSVDRALSPESK
jgi:putative oxidoreductase